MTDSKSNSSIQLNNRDQLLERCRAIADSGDVLAAFRNELRSCGVVGDTRRFELVYLASFTRHDKQPVSIVIKGSSASGKSYTLETALRYIPERAYFKISGMSPKALQHSSEDFRHRHIVIGEFSGLQSIEGNTWLRQLLSDRELVYSVAVPKEGVGYQTVTKKKEGPTGVMMTTTEIELHPEDESRMLSVYIDDGEEQTRAVLASQAAAHMGRRSHQPAIGPWHALHDWIDASPKFVINPYAETLSGMVDWCADRMKRDFPQVLNLIVAHALLNQQHRQRDQAGRIIATLEDYEAVYRLTNEWICRGMAAIVDPGVALTVDAVVSVSEARRDYHGGVPQYVLAEKLNVNKSTTSRHVKVALTEGWLINHAERGHPAKLLPGEPLPTARKVFPTPEELAAAVRRDSPEAASDPAC